MESIGQEQERNSPPMRTMPMLMILMPIAIVAIVIVLLAVAVHRIGAQQVINLAIPD